MFSFLHLFSEDKSSCRFLFNSTCKDSTFSNDSTLSDSSLFFSFKLSSFSLSSRLSASRLFCLLADWGPCQQLNNCHHTGSVDWRNNNLPPLLPPLTDCRLVCLRVFMAEYFTKVAVAVKWVEADCDPSPPHISQVQFNYFRAIMWLVWLIFILKHYMIENDLWFLIFLGANRPLPMLGPCSTLYGGQLVWWLLQAFAWHFSLL